ncbi:[pyruvate dehydrogenase (acetyl-transferring)]-phosphatase [Malassezia equina]|uniref:[pyruvate dehydrogenase (Acetyl-transferring)]-phosphatase n=1 Tax=Malassezia equina TaxID=1381935 RepID=A0AAF0EHK0_9BASI|nr:[pyruvate dehydrogenase (acetyl-transferring)]-phosphatase [Malassezia equina]
MLSRKLIAFVALELDKVFKETGEYAQMARSQISMTSSIWRSVFGGNTTRDSHRLAAHALDGNPDIVKRALTKGFRGLDKEILTTPLELLKQYELNLASLPKGKTKNDTNSLSALAHSIWPSTIGDSKSTPFSTVSQSSAYESILPALSGSCALMVYVDSARRDLYVASTGDSRAVAGYWDERAGRWEVEALTIDQTGRNQEEVKRIQREHPMEEAPYVIQRGRVLGGLEPTRAFGDARYKWDEATQKRVAEAFLPQGRVRLPPRGLKTPPYVTAEPVVEWRRIPGKTDSSMDNSLGHDSGSSSPSKELRFIIMASDGLWDLMSNEEAVSLVAGHLAGMRGSVRATDLQRMCFESAQRTSTQAAALPASAETPTAAESRPAEPTLPHHPLLKSPHHIPAFTFEDDNLSTHLVRNALGGAARERVAGLLAIPSPESRRYRDDVRPTHLLFPLPSIMASRQITFAEVCQHKTEESLWIVIDNKVYDVTKFLTEHPGGDEVLLTEACKDATEPFEDVGHSEDARKTLKTFYIGDLTDPENMPKTGRKASDMMAANPGGSPPLIVIVAIAAVAAYFIYNHYVKK